MYYSPTPQARMKTNRVLLVSLVEGNDDVNNNYFYFLFRFARLTLHPANTLTSVVL